MDQPKIERILKLMKLLTGNVVYTIEQMAEMLDTSPRTIYRYIDTFKSAGFVVTKNGDGFQLAKESPFFKDISQLVHFTDEEAFMVNKLIDGLDNTNIIKENLRAKLATIYNITSIADVVIKGENASNVNHLIEAIEEKKQAVLKNYRSGNSNKTSDRIVEPFEFTTNYINIWCFDVNDKKNKLFKTERIESTIVLDSPQIYVSQHSSGFMDVFRMHGERAMRIKLELGTLAHNLLCEEYPLAEKYSERIDSEKWLLSVDVANLKGIARFVIGVMDDVRIIEGDSLREYIANYCKTYLGKI